MGNAVMTENGYVLARFNTMNEAQRACADWCKTHQKHNHEILTQAMA